MILIVFDVYNILLKLLLCFGVVDGGGNIFVNNYVMMIVIIFL